MTITYPDAYHRGRAKRLGVAERTISDGLKRLGITYKKTLKHPKIDEEARIVFRYKITNYEREGHPLVYLDESGFALDQPRIHSYACKGKRCYGVDDWHAKGCINAIGAIIGFTFLCVGLFESNLNSDVFYAWVVSCLVPVLPTNAVVIIDNVSFHKRTDILEAIENTGVTVEFLPAYSPDLNPIEKKWAQAKAIRKKTHCDVDTLFTEHIL